MPTPYPYMLSLRPDVTFEDEGNGRLVVRAPLGTATLSSVGPGLVAALKLLATTGATEDQTEQLVLEHDGALGMARYYYELGRWKDWRLLRYSVPLDGLPMVSVEPMTQAFRLGTVAVDPSTRVTLSRFAFARKYGGELVIESPLSHARTLLHGRAGTALLAELNESATPADLAERVAGLPLERARALVALLLDVAIASRVEDDVSADDADPVLQQWAFHDLLFHTRSRIGRHDYPFGGRFRFLGKLPPRPALKPPMSNDTIELYRPDLDHVAREERPLTTIIETRRSIRAYDDEHPITLRQLGELLYRAARVRLVIPPAPELNVPYESSNRPYASGGASYEQEIYLTVNTCAGLASGLYHYDPLNHHLERLSGRTEAVEELLRDAWLSAARLAVPQVLVSFAARFQRLGWKYDSMAYAAILKNVGVLYQTLYLVATSMGLAPCALGSGNSDLLARAAGTEPFVESSVGEFMLGSLPAGKPQNPPAPVPPLPAWRGRLSGGPIDS